MYKKCDNQSQREKISLFNKYSLNIRAWYKHNISVLNFCGMSIDNNKHSTKSHAKLL